jgi:hypothetical protein
VSRGFCWLTLREGDHIEDTGLYGKMLKYIFRKKSLGAWTHRSGSG